MCNILSGFNFADINLARKQQQETINICKLFNDKFLNFLIDEMITIESISYNEHSPFTYKYQKFHYKVTYASYNSDGVYYLNSSIEVKQFKK